jgi:hypothetical protein
MRSAKSSANKNLRPFRIQSIKPTTFWLIGKPSQRQSLGDFQEKNLHTSSRFFDPFDLLKSHERETKQYPAQWLKTVYLHPIISSFNHNYIFLL